MLFEGFDCCVFVLCVLLDGCCSLVVVWDLAIGLCKGLIVVGVYSLYMV